MEEGLLKIEGDGKEWLMGMEEGDGVGMSLWGVGKVRRLSGINVMGKKGEVGKRIFEGEKYMV